MCLCRPQLADADFDRKWTLYGYPGTVAKKVAAVNKALDLKREEYGEVMKDGQTVFADSIKTIDSEVQSLQRFTDIGRVDDVAAVVSDLKARLADAKQQSQLFNSREGLFGFDVTEYSQINTITKAFEPYVEEKNQLSCIGGRHF